MNTSNTHPYIAVIQQDPAVVEDMLRRLFDSDAVVILHVDRSKPDTWTVQIGCASEEVLNRLEDGWA